MKRTIGLFLISIVTCIASSQAQARNIWRECGIGGMIFTNTGWAAISSNIIWDWGTTATSSNVSSEDMCEGPTASVAKFVHETYAVIEEQTVLGQGDHLVAMLDIMKCNPSSRTKIIKSIRSDFSKLLSDKSYEKQSRLDKAKNYHSIVINKVETNFSSKCHLI